jgi:long-chain acyl-CoA synthetase
MTGPPRTLAELFLRSIEYQKLNHLLVPQGQKWVTVSSQEFYRRVGRAHLLLKKLGLRKGDRCGLLSENRWEWAVADFAMMTAGIVSVPLYPTLTGEQIHYMLENSESRAVFVSTAEQKQKVESVRHRLPALEHRLCFDEPWLDAAPLRPAEREEFEAAIREVQPDDLASIIYTSGTTGIPKGVMLTHANIASNVVDTEPDMCSEDVALSFLPLSHIFERMADYCYYLYGATVAHVGAIDQVVPAMARIRPTKMAAVPRFFEKMYARLMDAIRQAPPLRRKIFFWAVQVGYQSTPYRLEGRPLPFWLGLKFKLADKLAFSKVRARLGGRIKLFISGSAPLKRELAEFFYAAGIPVLEGYGLTETSPAVTANKLEQIRFGTVGRPVRNVEVKIAPDGEILVRGPNVMRGYYRMERETREALADGWFHTGDIGSLDADGYLTILDRKKDLLKTSGGKYIAPQPIENRLKSSPLIADAMVIAEGRRFPSAILIPNFAELERLARERGIAYGLPGELARESRIVARLEKEVEELCAPLAPFEKIKRIVVLDREFSIAEGEITPTLKIRRREVERRYRDAIEKMYEEVSRAGAEPRA